MYEMFSCPAGRYCLSKTGAKNLSEIYKCRFNPVSKCSVGIICPPDNYCNEFVDKSSKCPEGRSSLAGSISIK
jgi:hypothetical protein